MTIKSAIKYSLTGLVLSGGLCAGLSGCSGFTEKQETINETVIESETVKDTANETAKETVSETVKETVNDTEISFVTGTETHSDVSENVTEPVTECDVTDFAVTALNTADPASASYVDEYLRKFGTDPEVIADSEQVITVDSSDGSCYVSVCEKENDSWICLFETTGAVGKNGVSANSTEGDYCTPEGVFDLGFAFGTQPVQDLKIEYREINENCYWVDDPLSPLYNQWVESDEISWNSAEHLIDYPSAYKYSVVINYNMDPVE
ncbi:MAG: hypothetical protein IKH50_07495, partial [Oscillospiraceae bacterium]|nr:hypothetical protein [Oscillospiraceae bacterium]